MSEIDNMITSFPDTIDEIRLYATDTQSHLMCLSKEYSFIVLQTKDETLAIELEKLINDIQEMEDNLLHKNSGLLNSLFHKNDEKRIKNKYRELLNSLFRLKVNLQLQQVAFLKEINLFGKMLEELKNCSNQFKKQIDTAEKKAKEHQSDQVFLQALEKRIEEIRLSHVITEQSIAQIMLLLQNASSFEKKLKDTVLITIPLWQNQIAFLFGLENIKQISEEQELIKSAITSGTKIAESERYEKIKEIDSKLSEELLSLKVLYQNELKQKQVLKEKFSI